MKHLKKAALFACALAALSLPVLAHADDMMPNPTAMATDAATAKMKDTTQPAMDKMNAMKASGNQTMDKANAMTNTDAMTKTATDKTMPDTSGMMGMGK